LTSLYFDVENVTLRESWPVFLLAIVVALADAGYLARLHYDIARARRTARWLEQNRRPLGDLVESIHGRPRVGDDVRGRVFVLSLDAVISIAFGIVTYVISREVWLALVAPPLHFLAASICWRVAVLFAGKTDRSLPKPRAI
jgi:hypothetical protein